MTSVSPSPQGMFKQQLHQSIRFWQRKFEQNPTPAYIRQNVSNMLKAIQMGLRLPEIWADLHKLVLALSPYIERWEERTQWPDLLERVANLARKQGQIAASLELGHLRARALQAQQRHPETIAAYRQVIRLGRQHNQLISAARACSNLGYLYAETGSYWRAEILCRWALTVFEPAGEKNFMAHTENHLGVLYRRQNRWEPARFHLERACQLWREVGEQHGLMRGLYNLSALLIDTAAYEQALATLGEAQELAQRNNDESSLGWVHLNRANTYRQQGKFQTALADYYQAEMIMRPLGDSMGLAFVWHNRGVLYTWQQEWEQGRIELTAALSAWQQQSNIRSELLTRFELIGWHLAQGQQAVAQQQVAQVEALMDKYGQESQRIYLERVLERYRGNASSKVGSPHLE